MRVSENYVLESSHEGVWSHKGIFRPGVLLDRGVRVCSVSSVHLALSAEELLARKREENPRDWTGRGGGRKGGRIKKEREYREEREHKRGVTGLFIVNEDTGDPSEDLLISIYESSRRSQR